MAKKSVHKSSKKKTKVSLKKKRQQKEIRTDICAVYIRLYTNEEQSEFIYRAGGSCRFVHNKLLSWHDERQEEYKKENPDISPYYTLLIPSKEYGKKLTELRHEESNAFLLDINSKFCQQAMNDLITSFTNHVKYPDDFGYPNKKKKKSHRYSFRVPIDAIPGSRSSDGINCVNGNRISICSALQDVLFDCSKRDMRWLNQRQKEIRSITVVGTPDGKFYASVLMTAQPITAEETGMILALDYGLKDFMSTHRERIEIDDDGFVELTGEEISHKKYVKLKDFKEPGQKMKAYERAGESRLEHYQKQVRHKQKILSRKEYNKEEHKTQRNKDRDRKNKKFDRDAYLESKREERYASYLKKRATTKLFEHKKKERIKQTRVDKPVNDRPWRKSSSRYERARKAYAAKEAKVANYRDNYIQKTTTQIVRENDMIGTETLMVQNMMQNHCLAGSIQNAGWGYAAQAFKWKCARYWRIYSRIDTFEASSKVCHVCGHHFDDLTLDVREMVCPECGTHLDRDDNASDVICTKSVKKYNEERYEKLYGEPLEQTDDVPSSSEQRTETSIKNELPLSSGSRDVEMSAAGAASKQPSKVPMNRQSKCGGK